MLDEFKGRAEGGFEGIIVRDMVGGGAGVVCREWKELGRMWEARKEA